MTISRWTALSWAVRFAEHGITIAALSALGLIAWLGGTWWNDRRNRTRRQATTRAAAPRHAPAWAHPDLADDDWERLHAAVHQHGRAGTDQQLREQCEEIYNRQETASDHRD